MMNYQRIIDKVADNIFKSDIIINLAKEDRLNRYLKYEKAIKPYEGKFTDRISSLFKQQRDEVLNNLKNSKGLYKSPQKIAAWMFGKKAWQKIFEKEGKEVIQGMVLDFGERTLTDLTAIKIAFDIKNPRVIEFIKNNGIRFGKETQNTAYEGLKKSFIEGIENGEGIRELSKRVETYYSDYTEGKKWKAERIARTETIKASNYGIKEGMKQSEVVIGKEWLTTMDGNERGLKPTDQADHHSMNGQRVKIDDLFMDSLSGDKFDFPGDPDNGATLSGSINCRCTMIEILEGEKI